MKKLILFILLSNIGYSLHAQLAVAKLIGKNSANTGLGYGIFAYWDIPLNDIGNRSIMIELLDFAYFPPKDPDINSTLGYISIKAGYKYIFSEESKTGFYIEPSAGYCRVVSSDGPDGSYGDGVAIAAEAGYSLEVGQRANTLNFGLKYEKDLAGGIYNISMIAFRVSYSFHLFRKKDSY